MALPPKQLGPIMRQARRRLGLKQRELAADLDTAQSNISAFESGHEGALAREKIELAAARLGIDPDSGRPLEDGKLARALRVRKYCSRAGCCSNVPIDDRGEVIFWPRVVEGLQGLEEYCRSCGEPLRETCPQCGTPVLDKAAYCERCGGAYVVTEEATPEDAAQWADERRRRTRELWEMLDSRSG